MTDCPQPDRPCPFDENTRIQLARMGDQMDHLTDRFEHMENQLGAIDTALRGNGKPGLTERVRTLESAHRKQAKWAMTAIATALSAAAAVIVAWFKRNL